MTATLLAEDLEQQVLAFVCAHFRLPAGSVTPRDRLVYDLGADSSDVLDLSLRLSAHFACDLDTERIAALVSVADICLTVRLALRG